VPQDFRFGSKVPNSITLTHYYKKKKTDTLEPNRHFLSVDLMERFLELLSPLSNNLGTLIFQFEYLNKQKMPSGLSQFIDLFGTFAERLPAGLHYSMEPRNPNYLNSRYFNFLNSWDFSNTFLHGYYMPSIFDLYKRFGEQIRDKW